MGEAMAFSLDEARTGHRRAQDKLTVAQSALDGARGRHERREALERVEQASVQVDVTSTILSKIEKQYALQGGPPRPRPPRPQPDPRPEPEPRRVVNNGPTPCSKSQALEMVRLFGEQRTKDGDTFVASPSGYSLYSTGPQRVGIALWGDENEWMLSIYSAARIGMTPTLDLYRFVSRWRTTAGLGAPYVVERDGYAAVMCERLFESSQLHLDVFPYIVPSTIDRIGGAAQQIAAFLGNADGEQFAGRGIGGLLKLTALWEVNDDRIEAFVNGFS